MDGLYDFLKQRDMAGEYVLAEHAEMYLNNSDGVSYRVKKCLKSLKIETVSYAAGRTRAVSVKDVHSLRHTFCYIAAISGVPLPVIQSIVGHMDEEMTNIYTSHVTDIEARKHMVNIPDAFGQALQPVDTIPRLKAIVKMDNIQEMKRELKNLIQDL